jgi:alkaline phosphatase
MKVVRTRRTVRVAVACASTGALMFLAGVAVAANGGDLSLHGGATRSSGDKSRAVRNAVDSGRAQNVILLIGDGMGDSEITAARNYIHGAAGKFPGIDALPLTGQYTTYSLTKDGKPDYDPDSASTGTAWATGTKTYDNAVSVDIRGQRQATLLELAKAKGLRTGNVTTAEIQDATPAVQVSHISRRSCYGPDQTSTTCPEAALENGGLGSITEQLLKLKPDVTLGGGAATFSQEAAAGRFEGLSLLKQAEARHYQVVRDEAGLNGIRHVNQRRPLLGLFAEGNMATRWAGPQATANGGALDPVECTRNPDRPSAQPSLAEMTTKAIDLLDNDKGFFLQVESASIDKRDHAADACGQIGETLEMDEAVQVALKFAKENGNTSVFVTADHAHTSQIVEAGSTTPGLTVNLLTADDEPMTLAYGTAPAGGSQQHTGSQVRVAGYGPKAANIVGLTDQTDLHFTIASALGLATAPKPDA